MIRNYFRVILRNLARNKFYSSINIIGLAVGLATCLLIFLYVVDELSFDRFNKKADRIFRVNNEVRFGDNYFDLAQTPALMGVTMMKDFSQVEQYTRLRWRGGLQIKKDNENISEDRVGYADSTLFDVFSLTVLSGNPRTALVEPRSIVLTKKIALKYFGSTNAVGKTLTVNDSLLYKVTAVIENISQSHFNFDIFLPMREDQNASSPNWLSENWNTYVVLKNPSDRAIVEKQLTPFIEKYSAPVLKSVINLEMGDFKKSGGYIRASLTPLTDIHLRSNKNGEIDANGNIQFVYIFTGIALLILLIACVNFMNLSTARSANRAKEVGIRKVLGSFRKNLIQQFLAESLFISLIALVFAMAIAILLLPYFNQLSGKTIPYSALFQPQMIFALIGLVIVVGLLAGSYPAFFLSSFQPIDVLKGKLAGGFKRSWLRNSLVVFQFVISIVLIFGTIVIYNQLDYIRKKDVGFNRANTIVLNNTNSLGDQINSFRDELVKLTGVENASISDFLPAGYNRNNDAFFTSPALDQQSAISMQIWSVDEYYLPTLDMKLIQGRNFSKDFPTDSFAIIVNEAAVKFLATKDVLNKHLYEIENIESKAVIDLHIIGVIKNFHFNSLREVVTPLALRLEKSRWNISVRIQTGKQKSVLAQVESMWNKRVPDKPFSYTFMDEDFNRLYTAEQRTGKIFISFAILAILIASLGLFGLITFAAEQRVKEIGIRKVLGASVTRIATMLTRDFLVLVLISSVIAFPIAWWAMNKWLMDFAYRTNIGWWIFVLAGVMALLIALLTTSFQAIKAGLANPAKSLKTE
jgi:putative ABC transport system permease protein